MGKRQWFKLRPWQRHSAVLMVGGLVYIGVGTAFFDAQPTPAQARSLKVALNMLSLDHWGYVFIFAGLLACLSARWPTFSHTWGYMVLCGLSAGWSATYFIGFVNGAPTSNINAGLIWGLMGFMWWAVSGLLNPNAVEEVAEVLVRESD